MDLEMDGERLVKRQIPFVAIGKFLCSYCVIDICKDLIGINKPDILSLGNHENMEKILSVEKADQLAFECLEMLKTVNNVKDNEITFCLTRALESIREEGSIFVGLLTKYIREDETIVSFGNRVNETIKKLGLIVKEHEENGESDEKENVILQLIEDIMFFYTKNVDELDRDDYDDGSDAGYTEGSVTEHLLSKIALYRILKTTKTKDIQTFLEDFDSTVQNLKSDDKFLEKWYKKYEKDIEKEDEKNEKE